MTTSERFWSKVARGEGCWEWTACTAGPRRAHYAAGGYGQFRFASKTVLAHRMAWELHNGPIPDGLVVCHECDNPKCVRPSHLFLGTSADNSRDMDAKGRRVSTGYSAPGEMHWKAKLTWESVREIRALRAAGVPVKDVANRFGIKRCTVSNIANGDRWRSTGTNQEMQEHAERIIR